MLQPNDMPRLDTRRASLPTDVILDVGARSRLKETPSHCTGRGIRRFWLISLSATAVNP